MPMAQAAASPAVKYRPSSDWLDDADEPGGITHCQHRNAMASGTTTLTLSARQIRSCARVMTAGILRSLQITAGSMALQSPGAWSSPDRPLSGGQQGAGFFTVGAWPCPRWRSWSVMADDAGDTAAALEAQACRSSIAMGGRNATSPDVALNRPADGIAGENRQPRRPRPRVSHKGFGSGVHMNSVISRIGLDLDRVFLAASQHTLSPSLLWQLRSR